MKKIKQLIIGAALSVVTFLFTACNTDAEFYTQADPGTFYTSQDAVWQRFNRPFTHWRWYRASDDSRYRLQQLGTDELCLPTRGSDWYNGGETQLFHHHEYSTTSLGLYNGWYGFGMGIALAYDALDDIDKNVNFEALGFLEGTKESMLAQQNALVAFFYKEGLDLFGGVPIYRRGDTATKGRNTDVETFNFIDSLLDITIPLLPKKTELGKEEIGNISQAVAMGLKAELYFNAEAYIKKPMYEEAAQICRDIIDGKYGTYKLEDDWTMTFGFENDKSTEIMWGVPSTKTGGTTDAGFFSTMHHYNSNIILGGIDGLDRNNGYALVPSLKPNGQKYDYKLAGPFSLFEDTDVRKQQYVYLGGSKYRGMFMMGRQENPLDGSVCVGAREYLGEVITMVDQITYMKKLGTAEYPTINDLPSTIATGEENSGIRSMKLSPVPTYAEREKLGEPNIPVMRLTEFYYTLAECELRAGNKAKAAELINQVRARYFANGKDPNPVTATNLDKYRMLNEWKIEFLLEGRRRTDLIRWNAYVTENWWDHTASNDPNKNRFPIDERNMSANPLLVQNPGY